MPRAIVCMHVHNPQISVVITLVIPPLIFGDLTLYGVVVHTSVSGVAQGIIIPVLNAAFRR